METKQVMAKPFSKASSKHNEPWSHIESCQKPYGVCLIGGLVVIHQFQLSN